MHGNECVLHDFLRGSYVADQQRGKPHKRAIVGAIERGHSLTRSPTDRHPTAGHEGFGHVSGTRVLTLRFTKGHSLVCLTRPSTTLHRACISTNHHNRAMPFTRTVPRTCMPRSPSNHNQ